MGTTGMTTAIVILALLLVAGLAMLIGGLRGRRINDNPVCRGCGFDLLGIFPGGERCPECGKALGEAAVCVGKRERRRAALFGGAILTAGGVFVLGGLGAAAASGVNWNVYKPTPWLVRQAERGGPRGVAGAMEVLNDRLADDTLETAEIERIVASGLAAQADANRHWEPLWGDFIEAAFFRGFVGEGDYAAYLERSFDTHTVVQDKARPGTPIIVELASSIDRGGTLASHELRTALVAAGVDGELERFEVDRDAMSRGFVGGRAGAISMGRGLSDPPQKIGEHRVRSIWRVLVMGAPDGEPLAAWEVDETHTLRIIGDGESLVELVTDPAMVSRARAGLEVLMLRARRSGGQGAWVEYSIRSNDRPVAICMDVLLRTGSGEYPLASVVFEPSDASSSTSGSMALVQGLEGERGVLVLRPSEEAAARAEVERMLGTKIEIPVEIEWIEQ
jgi:hypothetical protein